MSDISEWSISASSNASAAPNGWPDGQAPATVKDTGREMMAAIRRQFNDEPWFNWGDSKASNNLSKVSATSFKMDGDTTSRYFVNRRLRMNDATTLYGSITEATFSGAANTRVVVNLDTGSLTASLTAVALSSIIPIALPPSVEVGNNILINGDFVISQRGTAFTAATTPANNDQAYLIDRWRLLTDGNDVFDVSQETSVVPTGSRAAAKLLVATANKQGGMATMMEQKDSAQCAGNVVSFSFKARNATVTNLDKLRAGIVVWTGTADSLPTDIVGATGWSGVEGTDPSLTAGAAFVNTPSNLVLTTSYQTFQIEAINAGSTVNNIGVFIWVDNVDAVAGEIVYLSDCQLNVGAAASTFEVRPVAQELELCKRYYETSYENGAGISATTTGQKLFPAQVGSDGSQMFVTPKHFEITYQAPKRVAPTTVVYSPAATTAGLVNLALYSGTTLILSSDRTISTDYATVLSTTKNKTYYSSSIAEIATYSVSTAKYYQAFMRYHYTADAEL